MNSVSKESLIDFIRANYDELVAGGCADYSNRFGMNLADFNACERVISDLIQKTHRVTYNPDK